MKQTNRLSAGKGGVQENKGEGIQTSPLGLEPTVGSTVPHAEVREIVAERDNKNNNMDQEAELEKVERDRLMLTVENMKEDRVDSASPFTYLQLVLQDKALQEVLQIELGQLVNIFIELPDYSGVLLEKILIIVSFYLKFPGTQATLVKGNGEE